MKRPGGKLLASLWLMPCMLVFCLFQVAPLLSIAVHSLRANAHWSLDNYRAAFDLPFYRQAIANSLTLAVWSSLIGIVVAAFACNSLRRIDSRLRGALMAFAAIANNFAGVPLAFALIVLLGFDGCLTLFLQQWGWMRSFNLYSETGLILLYAYFQIPLGLLLLYPAFDALGGGGNSDANAGAGPSARSLALPSLLPTLLPALLGTFAVMLANALGAYAAIYALTAGNYNILPIRMARLAGEPMPMPLVPPAPHLASALAMLLAGLLLLVTLIHQWLLRKSYRAAP
jgi:putative spermidine/putrescine transport system permease protein